MLLGRGGWGSTEGLGLKMPFLSGGAGIPFPSMLLDGTRQVYLRAAWLAGRGGGCVAALDGCVWSLWTLVVVAVGQPGGMPGQLDWPETERVDGSMVA